MILDELLKAPTGGIRDQTGEVGDRRLPGHGDGQLMGELPRGDCPTVGRAERPLRQIELRYRVPRGEGCDLV
jgi:hypothetical protein